MKTVVGRRCGLIFALAAQPAPAPAQMAIAAAMNWTYVAIEGGSAHGRFSWTDQISGVSEELFNNDGRLIGGTL